MARVKRGGRELTVADSEVRGYLEQGYSLIDDKGNVLTPTKAITYVQAMTENAQLKRRIAELNKTIETANAIIAQKDDEIATLKLNLEEMVQKPSESLSDAPYDGVDKSITDDENGQQSEREQPKRGGRPKKSEQPSKE